MPQSLLAQHELTGEIRRIRHSQIWSIRLTRLFRAFSSSDCKMDTRRLSKRLHGQGNLFSIAITMPLPEYRLLTLPQFSLLSLPVAATLPLAGGELTAFGDVRFVDLAVIDPGHRLLFGVGPTFVFPTANTKKNRS